MAPRVSQGRRRCPKSVPRKPPTATRRSTRRTGSRQLKPQNAPSDLSSATESDLVGNTSGLATLPVELLTEIIAYLPSMALPFTSSPAMPICRTEHKLSRLNFLRALCQTCRFLRNFALPLRWETIEAISCDPKEMRRNWRQAIAVDLIRQLEVVTIRDPSLAQYVRVVNVLITSYSVKGVLEELTRGLVQFPNLRTLQILGDGNEARHFEAAFRDLHLPEVRILGVTPDASSIISCCPGVRRINGLPFALALRKLPAVLPHIEEVRAKPDSLLNIFQSILLAPLGNRDGLTALFSDGLASRCPNLRVADLEQHVKDYGYDDLVECLRHLKAFKDLHCIRIHYVNRDYIGGKVSLPYVDALGRSRPVLEALPPPLPGCHRCVITIHGYEDDRAEHQIVAGTMEGRCIYL